MVKTGEEGGVGGLDSSVALEPEVDEAADPVAVVHVRFGGFAVSHVRFVVAPAGAQRPREAGGAIGLLVDVRLLQEARAFVLVDALLDGADAVAARLYEAVAQAELASQNGPQPLEQSIGQILSELKSHRGGTLLLDPRLLSVVEQNPDILKQFKNYSRSPLEPSAYSGVLAGMDPAQLQAIRSWLASPQLENADTELLELLKTRAQSFEDRLDRERATIATSIELSLALALLSS